MSPRDAILGFATAFVVALVVTPLTARVARAVGAVDKGSDRGLAKGGTPLLGGLAMLVAILVGAALFLDSTSRTHDRVSGILYGAVVIAVVGALDDRFDLPAAVKFLGQFAAAFLPVHAGVEVTNITLPFVGAQDFGSMGEPLTIVGLVLVMNVVNFSDGIDGLAAGVCAIAAGVFAIIAFDLERRHAGILAALTAGAALGFLVHNFHPASVFMGDCGSNLLGLMLGCIAVEGAVKTQAVLALVFPLLVLAVPFLDTTFVVLKRMKYGRPVWQADANHLHHRLSRIGFSQRRAVLYLYGWTLLLGAFAVALRFVPYSDDHGNLNTGWSVVMGLMGLMVAAASVYLVVVLEILKVKRLVWMRGGSQADESAVDAEVQEALATGEFPAVKRG
ncbi:Undecaprenyl-phosphate alpha-N-acetylglucosaminyl 1-phosphate transferase [Paraconexibacter sp. AEG42_29]|uniref:Undecaprenyl-phosphate alpha-N-acetylglucosaminyl 1-phosphate transferase n=1 Tax=Paraconexibacter sp. AEG42_29 TaxID=2997339 RepID=A0AAU7ATE6_9ACTN